MVLALMAVFSTGQAQVQRQIPLITILEPGVATNVCNEAFDRGCGN
jgi:hypothetical protein